MLNTQRQKNNVNGKNFRIIFKINKTKQVLLFLEIKL